jgi:hypothetical protein
MREFDNSPDAVCTKIEKYAKFNAFAHLLIC